MSLISLAEQGNLPLHQYMDKETIGWIAANNIFEGPEPVYFPKISIEKLIKFIPPDEWFLDYRISEGIHGLRHLLRVGIFSLTLCAINLIPEQKKENLLFAAVLHDIRRICDKDDENHGKRTAEWFLKDIKEITDQFGLKLNEEDKDEIHSLIYCHDLDYDQIKELEYYKKHNEEVDLFKTADALDRYRLPKIKWWFDPNKVKLFVSRDLMNCAYNLVLLSERRHLDGTSNIESVVQSLNSLLYGIQR